MTVGEREDAARREGELSRRQSSSSLLLEPTTWLVSFQKQNLPPSLFLEVAMRFLSRAIRFQYDLVVKLTAGLS